MASEGVQAKIQAGENGNRKKKAAGEARARRKEASGKQAGEVASGEEILEFLTGVMRGSEDGSTQTMKAAELLGKRMGLFAEQSPSVQPPIIIDDIGGGGDD